MLFCLVVLPGCSAGLCCRVVLPSCSAEFFCRAVRFLPDCTDGLAVDETQKEDEVGPGSSIVHRGGKHTILGNKRLRVRQKAVEGPLVPLHRRLSHLGGVRKSLYETRPLTEKALKGRADFECIPRRVVTRPAGRGGTKAAVKALPIGRVEPGPHIRERITSGQTEAGQDPGAYHRRGG